jgi:23S rRNA (uracil1939-C5)-methyltransferase
VPRARVTLTDVAFGGEALGHLDGRVVFVPFGLPGEEVEIEIVEDRRDYARGEIVEILTPSAERVEPRCQYFGACGGCSWQHADYSAALRFKREVVVDQLRRIGGIVEADALVPPTLGMLDPWNYRNQARFALGRRYGELCFTHRGTHRLIGIDECHIAQPAINDLLGSLQRRMAGQRIHQIVLRASPNTAQTLVNPALPLVPEVESGQSALEEEILTRRFRVAGAAFFQVNTLREMRPLPEAIGRARAALPAQGLSMADLLALLVLDRLDPRPSDLVLDVYCGVGVFASLLAPLVARVIGIEESAPAVRDARANTADLSNVTFLQGKAEHLIASLEERPAAVVLDPARVGCDPAVLAALLRLRPERLVYVSCDPATLARDLRILLDGGYSLKQVQPLDMFPQTYHVECVATLRA